jgi:GH15 family glucan-1,4-alpha-glucosidase
MTHFHQRSIDIIRAGQAQTGAYVASPTFSQYGYSWLRDGTWIAYGMARAGQNDSTEAFHRWAARTIVSYQANIETVLDKLQRGETPLETDYLPTRFHVDGSLGSDEWTDFQLDGYGAWLWGLADYCQNAQHPLWQEVRPAVQLMIRYLAALWQSPNYDCWEEFRNEIHTATLAALYGGIKAAQNLDAALVPIGLPEAIRNFTLANCVAAEGHFMKFIGNDAVDASLLWVAVPYRLVDINDPRFKATLAKIERDLRHPDGGVYRYQADTYFGGGEWLLLAAWLGWAYVELGRHDEARQILAWIESQANANGEMPEQVLQHTRDASYIAHWEQKWGTAACPLLWSHAMYLVLEAKIASDE